MMNDRVDVIVHSDSRTLVDGIHSTSKVSSMKLQVDIACIKEMVEKNQIKEIDWVNTKNQIADSLTKEGVSPGELKKYIGGEV